MNAPVTSTPTRAVSSTVIVWLYAFLPANLIPTIIGRLVNDFGVDVTTAGFVATGMTLINSATVLGVAPLVRRGHRTSLALAGAGILIAVSVIGMFFQSGALICVLLLVAGAGSGLALATASASVSATSNPARSANIAMIFNRLVVAVAYFMVPVLGTSMFAIFLILCIPGFLVLFTARWLPEAPRATAAAQAAPARARAASAGKVAWMLAIAMGLLAVTDDGVIGLSELIGIAFFGEGGSALALNLYAIATLAGLVGALIAPLLIRLAGQTNTLVIALGLSLVSKVALLVIPSTVVFSLGYLGWGFAFGLCLPVIFGLAAALRPDGSASVAVNGVYVLGVALGPTVAAQVFNVGGTPALALVMGAIGLLASALMVAASIVAKRETPGTVASPSTPDHAEPVAVG